MPITDMAMQMASWTTHTHRGALVKMVNHRSMHLQNGLFEGVSSCAIFIIFFYWFVFF